MHGLQPPTPAAYRSHHGIHAQYVHDLLSTCANAQVLDKAFMSGVLVMTAFWATAVAKNPTAPPPPSDKTVKVPNNTAKPSNATGIIAPFRWTTTAADASSVPPPAAAKDTAATSMGVTHSSSSGPSSGITPEIDSSSLAAVQILNSLSYLQFCRMRLTAYNTVLKAVLTSASTSPQVQLDVSEALLL